MTTVLAASGGLLLFVSSLLKVQRDHFLACRGAPYEIAKSVEMTRSDGSTQIEVRLGGECGPQVNLRALIPVEAQTRKVATLLLIGGHRTGSKAVDLVEEPDGIAYAAIDYPYDGSDELSGALQILAAIPRVQNAFLDSPPALMRAMDWLSDQTWFDPDRAELAGVSLGVPFAAAAGALDPRFTRVWLIHGATDNYEWLMHAAERHVENKILRATAVRASLLLVHGNSFRTADWIRDIAPRPAILIAARDDERMSRQSLESILAVADSKHVSLIWTQGRHVDPDREFELRQLMELVVGAMTAS